MFYTCLDFVSCLKNYMTSLDAFVQKLVSSDPSREQELATYVKSVIDHLKRYTVPQLDVALQTIDIRRASHGILALLYAKSSLAVADEELFIVQIGEFFRTCIGEQIRPLARYFAHLCHHFTDLLCKRHEALRGLMPVSMAVEKLQLHSTQLTSIHSDLCQLCLASGCFKPALKHLDVDYVEINNEDGHLDAKLVLCFYYYGGCIYAARRQFDRALLYFELVLTVPASVMSYIMVDAYKKMILTSLIVNGKGEVSLDVMISRYVRRQAHLLSQPYVELSQAFTSENMSKLQMVIDKEHDVFVSDRNLGLVKYVKKALVKHNIKKLARAYVTLSLAEVAKQIGLPSANEAVDMLSSMVEGGEIDASIDEKQAVVTFSSDSSQRFEASDAALAKIDAEARYLIDVLKQIRTVDESLETNPQWLKKITSGQD